jgi:nesprin-1
VKETERSTSITALEKVSKYEESIQRLKECETQLALASDKGQQIANEGSTADRNQITSQLQSLKTQIVTLKKAIEKKRDEHIQSVAEQNRTFKELEECIEWLTTKEADVKSRPVLSTTVQDVEAHLTAHQTLASEIMEYIDKVKVIQNTAKMEMESSATSGRLCDLLSTASAFIQTMPREMEARQMYLETNRNLRLQYDSLVERLNTWIEEAQIKLRPLETGVDFVHLTEDLQDHITYFSEETKLRELLHSIHDIANKIWASLGSNNQDKINHEQEFLTQLVKNTLNSAHVKQRDFEQSLKTWISFQETLERTKSTIIASKGGNQEPQDRPTSVAAVKTAILKVDTQIKIVMGHKQIIDAATAEAKKIEELADSSSRQQIAECLLELNHEWKCQLAELKDRKENLATLALQWEDFEAKYRSFETQLAAHHQRFTKMESTASLSTLAQMIDTKKMLQVCCSVFCLLLYFYLYKKYSLNLIHVPY